MTKEEILNNEIKDEPFYLSENLEPYIYKAMEIYAKQYHEQKECNLRREMQLLNVEIYKLKLENAEPEKQLTLYNVTQQRELLIAWEKHNQLWDYGNFDKARIEDIDDWLSNL